MAFLIRMSRQRCIFSTSATFLGYLLLCLAAAACFSSHRFSTTEAFSTNTPTFSADIYSSLGSRIQSIHSWSEGLEVASHFWLPSDEGLPPHFTQLVHHEKRQRWASHLLKQLATSLAKKFDHTAGSLESHEQLESLARLTQAAAMRHPSLPPDRLGKEASWILDSLEAIHAIVGRVDFISLETWMESSLLIEGIESLIVRAQALGADYSLNEACQALWAMEGIQSRIPSISMSHSTTAEGSTILQDRVQALPFEIIRQGVDWSDFVPITTSTTTVCDELLKVIPFRKDTITTRQGTSVRERRGTAWIAAPGIGALAYSGKLMPPQPLPTLASDVMRCIERQLGDRLDYPYGDDNDASHGFFDCALCNHYADATSACKFHTDPEHGTMWDRTTVVVAAGSDRTFAFKPIDTTWDEWDPYHPDNESRPLSSSATVAASTTLFAGDLVVMQENCNDDFYHAVHAGHSDDPRVSLVLKRAIGPRGHGLAGQGRRRKGRQQQQKQENTFESIGSESSARPTSRRKRNGQQSSSKHRRR